MHNTKLISRLTHELYEYKEKREQILKIIKEDLQIKDNINLNDPLLNKLNQIEDILSIWNCW